MKNSPDAELVQNLRLGQHQALTVLHDRYAGLVYSIAHQMQNTKDI